LYKKNSIFPDIYKRRLDEEGRLGDFSLTNFNRMINKKIQSARRSQRTPLQNPSSDTINNTEIVFEALLK
jgi:hypothetical protein